MLSGLDWLIIAAYVVFIIFIGLLYKNKASKSLSDYFLGGRQLPWVIAGLSMVATTFAADTPLAVTEMVGKNGISGNWLWWNFLIGGMLTTLFFAHLWHRAGVLTEVELIGVRYSGIQAKILRGFKAVYLGLFMNSLIIAWVNLALMTIIEVFFGIHGQVLFEIMLVAMLVAVLYSTLSGLWGVAVTDAVQFVIAMSGAIVLAVLVVNSDKIGGIEGLKDKLPASALEFFPKIGNGSKGEVLAISMGAFLAYGLVQWWASWYPGAEPGGGGYIAQRMMSTKNPRHSVYATLLFQISHYALRPWPWILVGLAVIVLYPGLEHHQLRYGYVMAMKDFLPQGLKGLILAGFLAAYMSTISTQLNFGASVLTNDFFLLINKKKLTDKQKVTVARIITLILVVVSLWVTTRISSISDTWKFILECGAGLGLVLILRWYWWRINAWSEIAATVTPFIVYALMKFVYKIDFPQSFFITVGVTTIVWLAVTFLTKPTDEETLKRFYSKVRPAGAWRPVAKMAGLPYKSLSSWLFLAWLSAVLMGYGILFFIGKLLLHFYTDALIFLLISLISVVVFVYSFKKAEIFN